MLTASFCRCNLYGLDLNRVWTAAHAQSRGAGWVSPSVLHTRSIIERLSERNGVVFYCDLHGHSRKHDVFCYGCVENVNGTNPMPTGTPKWRRRVAPIVFTKILGQVAADVAGGAFRTDRCSFRVAKSKGKTARVVVHREFKVGAACGVACSSCNVRARSPSGLCAAGLPAPASYGFEQRGT